MKDINQIIIKSQTKNRLRLKSCCFNQSSSSLIIQNIQNLCQSLRFNYSCNSLIIYFDSKNLDEILTALKKLFLKEIKSLQNTQESCVCKICDTKTSKVTKISWKGKIIQFLSLSVYAAYVFVAEQFFGVVINASAFSLISIVSLIAAIPLIKDAIDDVKQKRFTLQTFMSFALVLAILGGEATAAFEIIYILRASMLFEEYTAEKSKRQIHDLIKNKNKKAYRLEGNLEVEISLDDICENDIIVCRSGDKIPADGSIIKGSALIDESIINGRSECLFKSFDEEVFANTFIEKGRILIKVSAIGQNTYISRVISEVEKSLLNKSPGELAADKLAKKVLKLGSFLTLATFFITNSFQRAFSVMIIMSCPCSTILAASSAVSAGIAKGAKEGILIKGGEYLEKVSQSEVFCFDKTGTLTNKTALITDFVISENLSEEEFFKLAFIAEQRNSHPLAIAIINHAKKLKINTNLEDESEVVAGMGVRAIYQEKEILVGNAKFLKLHKLKFKAFENKAQKFLNEGKSIVYVSHGRVVLGFIALKNEVRKNVKQMLDGLKKEGKYLVLLTGDEKIVADNFAKEFNFDEVHSNLMPQLKADIVEELGKKYNNVVMIGDGINDTLAFSKANTSISFASGGSEAAIEVSNIAITHSHPLDILKLYKISKTSLNTINQNYWIGNSTNIIGVVLAGLGLLSPVLAGGVHIAHTAAIILNSAKISYINLQS